MNRKYEMTGHRIQYPYRSETVDDDTYFLHLVCCIKKETAAYHSLWIF